MPRPRILSVGQCGFDHAQLSRAFSQAFDAEVLRADTHGQALDALRGAGPFALVLVNRVGDSDGARGLDLIRGLKSDPDLAEVPVMLVSNYEDAQAQAEEAGALRGFGKSDLGSVREIEALRGVLST